MLVYLLGILVELVKIILVLVFVLLSVAFMTVLERKYLSGIQRRRGSKCGRLLWFITSIW